ncbi:MAG: beta-ketoacyl-ACP synthase II [Armatimonadota bacterium]|nr:MAG: beta-ketoacyl-ACP synthase II [Armatimonadota bacterium]
MERRVVVTGMGAVTPLGIGVDPTWEGMRTGRSGITNVTLFDASAFSSQIAGEVKDFDPASFLEPREVRHTDRFVQFAVAATSMAVDDAALGVDSVDRNRAGVLIGSGIGGTWTWEAQHRVLLEKGPGRISPFFIPMLITDMAAGRVAMIFDARGPNSAVATACATGAHALGDAAEIIRRGDAEIMIAGGAEAAVSPLALGGFCAMRALSRRNDDPPAASRPFDRDRDGFVMAEGAGILLLEEVEHARRRGVPIHGEIIGYGMSADAYHITQPSPDGDGMARAMEAALQDAALPADEIDYVNTHGTATPAGDLAETRALKRVFGDRAPHLPSSSTKSVTGHLLGAAGAVELIACLCAIRDQVVPPTINLDNLDPECDLDYVPNQARELPIRTAMSNSFGFGGHNATLIVRAHN